MPLHRLTGERDVWDSFKPYNSQLEIAFDKIAQWYTRGDNSALFIFGQVGCGKTHLARAIHQLYGYGSVFYNEEKLIKQIRNSYNRESQAESEGTLMARAEHAKLLIIDDFGTYHCKTADSLGWLRGIYYHLLDGRKEQGRATLVTSNLGIKVLANRMGGRVYDRFIGHLGDKENYIDLTGISSYRRRFLNGS